jgi:hypothetical protein
MHTKNVNHRVERCCGKEGGIAAAWRDNNCPLRKDEVIGKKNDVHGGYMPTEGYVSHTMACILIKDRCILIKIFESLGSLSECQLRGNSSPFRFVIRMWRQKVELTFIMVEGRLSALGITVLTWLDLVGFHGTKSITR